MVAVAGLVECFPEPEFDRGVLPLDAAHIVMDGFFTSHP
jgi:hypothetical protein